MAIVLGIIIAIIGAAIAFMIALAVFGILLDLINANEGKAAYVLAAIVGIITFIVIVSKIKP